MLPPESSGEDFAYVQPTTAVIIKKLAKYIDVIMYAWDGADVDWLLVDICIYAPVRVP